MIRHDRYAFPGSSSEITIELTEKREGGGLLRWLGVVAGVLVLASLIWGIAAVVGVLRVAAWRWNELGDALSPVVNLGSTGLLTYSVVLAVQQLRAHQREERRRLAPRIVVDALLDLQDVRLALERGASSTSLASRVSLGLSLRNLGAEGRCVSGHIDVRLETADGDPEYLGGEGREGCQFEVDRLQEDGAEDFDWEIRSASLGGLVERILRGQTEQFPRLLGKIVATAQGMDGSRHKTECHVCWSPDEVSRAFRGEHTESAALWRSECFAVIGSMSKATDRDRLARAFALACRVSVRPTVSDLVRSSETVIRL